MATVTLDVAALQKLAETAAERGLKTALLAGQRRLQADILNRAGSGAPSGKRKGHRRSAPGEAPAPDTGNLRAKTLADTELRREGSDLVGRIVANTDYAEALERGTERMEARPFMSRLKTEHTDELAKAFQVGAKG